MRWECRTWWIIRAGDRIIDEHARRIWPLSLNIPDAYAQWARGINYMPVILVGPNTKVIVDKRGAQVFDMFNIQDGLKGFSIHDPVGAAATAGLESEKEKKS